MKRQGKYFSLMYLFSYGAIGVLFPLIAQYLSKIGFTGAEIGIITSLSTAIGIVSNFFLGKIYHNKGKKKSFIALLSALTAFFSLLLIKARFFLLFMILSMFVFFFEKPIFPLIDSSVMEAGYSFGKARKWGALGFALGIGLAGAVADKLGLVSIFPIYCILFCLNALLILLYVYRTKDDKGSFKSIGLASGYKKTRDKEGYKLLFSNKKYMGLLLCAFFFNGTISSHNTYFSFLYLGVGGTLTGMGIVLLLMVISEAPVMAMTDRINRIIPMEKAILIAMGISAIRFLWYGMNPPVTLLAITFFLQGITNGIVLVEIVKYIESLVGTDMLSLALPLFNAIASSGGTIACQFLGGIILGRYGGSLVYTFYGLLNLLALSIYVFIGLHKRDLIKN